MSYQFQIDYDQVMAIINDTRPLADRLGIKTHEGKIQLKLSELYIYLSKN